MMKQPALPMGGVEHTQAYHMDYLYLILFLHNLRYVQHERLVFLFSKLIKCLVKTSPYNFCQVLIMLPISV
jgi:hypothetical protein